MAQELKELCTLLFPDSAPETVDQFGDVTDYIKKLGSQNWDHIRKEPERLTEEMKQLTEQTQELAFTNYKTFVETAEISKTIIKDLDKSKESLETFLDKTPEFLQECEKFSQMASNILKEKSRYSSIRNQSDKLLELLELSSLMREALNSEDYESALDIFTFVRNLTKRYSDIPIIQNTTNEIMTLWFETLYQLFNQLRYDLPLPQCLQILGYLRRANTVYRSTEEGEARGAGGSDGLHLHFLKARNAWFEKALEDARNTEPPTRAARRLVELHRLHLFNVLTQHKSIFLSSEEAERGGAGALACWLQLKVEALCSALQLELSQPAEAGFEPLLNQCLYLCASFGRVGGDMRAALAPLFREATRAHAAEALARALHRFDVQMRTYRLTALRSPPRAPPAEPALPPAESALPPTEPALPPGGLLEWAPLAEYCNALLSVLNAARLTAPLCLAKEFYDSFGRNLEGAARVVAAFGRRERQAASAAERQDLAALGAAFCDDLVPHLAACLAEAFPAARVAELLGVSLSALQAARLLQLDRAAVVAPLLC